MTVKLTFENFFVKRKFSKLRSLLSLLCKIDYHIKWQYSELLRIFQRFFWRDSPSLSHDHARFKVGESRTHTHTHPNTHPNTHTHIYMHTRTHRMCLVQILNVSILNLLLSISHDCKADFWEIEISTKRVLPAAAKARARAHAWPGALGVADLFSWASCTKYVAVCCSVLQCVAVRCSALQCVTGWCSGMQGLRDGILGDKNIHMISYARIPFHIHRRYFFYNALQHTATHCNDSSCTYVKLNILITYGDEMQGSCHVECRVLVNIYIYKHINI